jgi:hypothetical protein
VGAATGLIDEPLQRLNRAIRDEDMPLMIGCAKDLSPARPLAQRGGGDVVQRQCADRR